MNIGERKFVEYKLSKSGSFYNSLFETIFKADKENRRKLALEFPEEVEAVKLFQTQIGYFDKLLSEYEKG